MSSSVPSMEFDMPHFLKDHATFSSGRPHHASRTQEETVANEAVLTFPAGLRLFCPSTIQVVHRSQSQSLNGLLRQTSSGCRMLVSLPGITAISVLVWRSARFTGSTRWAQNESQTSRLGFLSKALGQDPQTFSIHSFIPSSSIQPFG